MYIVQRYKIIFKILRAISKIHKGRSRVNININSADRCSVVIPISCGKGKLRTAEIGTVIVVVSHAFYLNYWTIVKYFYAFAAF